MSQPITTIDVEDRDDLVGYWCEIVGAEDFLGIYEGDYLGGRIKDPNSSTPIYPGPENIIIRTDLPRAWTAEGKPPTTTQQRRTDQ